MFIVCLLILSGVGLYVTLKPPIELYDPSLKNHIFSELTIDSAQQAFEGASFRKED
ncbi:hypothetical protein [Paenibacillus qinlingensis]|uniref:Uncharacterized protein n=1 Tax=Paenibacillus qinlingensis TaxID=1837343 RepID=A0ABU1NY53_9BACL|nr:hypothetical protein [Paenibacillus qinlingensis]MDR6552410.1 hypothetical protein [Paenibacillus qinlingensis]